MKRILKRFLIFISFSLLSIAFLSVILSLFFTEEIEAIAVKNIKSKILLQIHDELIFETEENEVKNLSKLIKDEMTSVKISEHHSFSVPILVDLNLGDNWGLLH